MIYSIYYKRKGPVLGMYHYHLIEFTSCKKIQTIRSNKTILEDVLSEVYGDKIESMYKDTGELKGFVSVFINSKQIFSIKEITLNDQDEICVVTSISGG